MRTVVIIQARMNSTRLPGKVLMPLGHKAVLDWVLDAAHAIPDVDDVVLATSAEPSDDRIEFFCNQRSQNIFRGPLNDVLTRYIQAAQLYDADIVMRLTADCPFLDAGLCGNILKLLSASQSDYATNCIPRSWPKGLDCEVIRMDALLTASQLGITAYDREHVTPFIYNNPAQFKIANLPCPLPELEELRWTLDTPQDYEILSKMAHAIQPGVLPDFEMLLTIWQNVCNTSSSAASI